MKTRITVLGSGDTLGTPIAGCQKPACLDKNRKSKRYRFGIYIQIGGLNILVDPNPDIKWQMLDNNIHPRDIDIILTTHQHSDHVNGLGEFYYRRETPTKLFYGDHPLNHKLVDYWKYLEREGVLKFETYQDFEEFQLNEKVAITPIELNHGFPTSGFIIKANNKNIAIITDTNAKLNRRTLKELHGVDYMFADAFSEDYNQIKGVYEDCNIEVPELAEEWFHMTVQEVIELHNKVKANITCTIHMSRHLSPHDELVQKYQRDNFIIGYDGLRVEL